MLRRQGPYVPIEVAVSTELARALQEKGVPLPPSVTGLALVDTGASVSAVDLRVVQSLGLLQMGYAVVRTPNGEARYDRYPARFGFPGTDLPEWEFVDAVGCPLSGARVYGVSGEVIALLGRDILRRFVLVYNGTLGHFSLSC